MQVLLDANLLVLYVAGCTNVKIIAAHKRLRFTYDVSDFRLLRRTISSHDRLVLTPNTMTEASNLLAQIPGQYQADLRRGMKDMAATGMEIPIKSADALNDPDYLRLGLTDAAILTVLSDQVALLTADLDLYLAALKRGHRATNLRHLKDAS